MKEALDRTRRKLIGHLRGRGVTVDLQKQRRCYAPRLHRGVQRGQDLRRVEGVPADDHLALGGLEKLLHYEPRVPRHAPLRVGARPHEVKARRRAPHALGQHRAQQGARGVAIEPPESRQDGLGHRAEARFEQVDLRDGTRHPAVLHRRVELLQQGPHNLTEAAWQGRAFDVAFGGRRHHPLDEPLPVAQLHDVARTRRATQCFLRGEERRGRGLLGRAVGLQQARHEGGAGTPRVVESVLGAEELEFVAREHPEQLGEGHLWGRGELVALALLGQVGRDQHRELPRQLGHARRR